MRRLGLVFGSCLCLTCLPRHAVADAPPATRPAAVASVDGQRQPSLNDDLRVAVRKRDYDKAKALLDAGANAGPDSESGSCPLFDAALHGDFRMAELLLAHGADPNDPKQSYLPLVCASYFGKADVVAFLLDHGAKPDALSPNVPALHMAAGAGHVEVVKLLLAKGANVNAARIGNKMTALHRAADGRQPEVAKVLIAAGADITAKDRRGNTALDLANLIDKDRERLSRILKERAPAFFARNEAVRQVLMDAATHPATKPAQPATGPATRPS
jgi:ankyrin repeat protein